MSIDLEPFDSCSLAGFKRKPVAFHRVCAEAYRSKLMRGMEQLLAQSGYPLVAGVDEAGRGCLAGPVVAAAVLVDPTSGPLPGVDDSKQLNADTRRRLAELIPSAVVASASVSISPAIIDRINILEATRLAMLRALQSLDIQPDLALVDAVPLRGLAYPCLALPRADAMSYAVACASILAKERRDKHMAELDRRYPEYGFASNKGYGAKRHREVLAEIGPSPVHRLTFRSVLPQAGDAESRAVPSVLA